MCGRRDRNVASTPDVLHSGTSGKLLLSDLCVDVSFSTSLNHMDCNGPYDKDTACSRLRILQHMTQLSERWNVNISVARRWGWLSGRLHIVDTLNLAYPYLRVNAWSIWGTRTYELMPDRTQSLVKGQSSTEIQPTQTNTVSLVFRPCLQCLPHASVSSVVESSLQCYLERLPRF